MCTGFAINSVSILISFLIWGLNYDMDMFFADLPVTSVSEIMFYTYVILNLMWPGAVSSQSLIIAVAFSENILETQTDLSLHHRSTGVLFWIQDTQLASSRCPCQTGLGCSLSLRERRSSSSKKECQGIHNFNMMWSMDFVTYWKSTETLWSHFWIGWWSLWWYSQDRMVRTCPLILCHSLWIKYQHNIH